MGFGQQADKVANAALEAGLPVPESCIPPEIPDHLNSYVQHFWRLSTCRSVIAPGYPGPIPWVAIDQYANQIGVEDEALYDDMVTIIEAMDLAFLEEVKEKAKANGNSEVVSDSSSTPRSKASAIGW